MPTFTAQVTRRDKIRTQFFWPSIWQNFSNAGIPCISRLKKKSIYFKMWLLEELKFDVTNQAFRIISSPWDQGAFFDKSEPSP